MRRTSPPSGPNDFTSAKLRVAARRHNSENRMLNKAFTVNKRSCCGMDCMNVPPNLAEKECHGAPWPARLRKHLLPAGFGTHPFGNCPFDWLVAETLINQRVLQRPVPAQCGIGCGNSLA